MSRNIFCQKCGALKPMHPEDVMMGWKRRRVALKVRKPDQHFITINGQRQPDLTSLLCDECGTPIADGTEAVAVTMWRGEAEPPLWEEEYLMPVNPKTK